jgi:hypothetical protein
MHYSSIALHAANYQLDMLRHFAYSEGPGISVDREYQLAARQRIQQRGFT